MERYAIEYPENKAYVHIHLSVKPPAMGWISNKKDEKGEALKRKIDRSQE